MSVMLYKPDGIEVIWGINCEYRVFDNEDVEKALSDGWHRSPLDFDKVSEQGSDHEAELREKIKTLGGKAGGRSSIATLEKQLAEMEAKDDGNSND